jgi:phosphoglycolate phosphatase-like HAD superfamily hydrolase
MALLQINHVRFDADLVAFDKDGTLIEFDRMWIRLTEAWLEQLVVGSDDPNLAEDLHRTLGYDPTRQAIIPRAHWRSLYAPAQDHYCVGSLSQWRPGPKPRIRAEPHLVVQGSNPFKGTDPAGRRRSVPPGPGPAAGAQVAVVTTDGRPRPQRLAHSGIEGLVDALVCGDDDIPSKPAPDMLLAICERLRVKPAHTAVVGDTEADMLMAQRAGAGLCVAVLTGAGAPDQLAALADIVVSSIDAITVEVEHAPG